MRRRTSSTCRVPTSVSRNASGGSWPRARFGAWSQRLACSALPSTSSANAAIRLRRYNRSDSSGLRRRAAFRRARVLAGTPTTFIRSSRLSPNRFAAASSDAYGSPRRTESRSAPAVTDRVRSARTPPRVSTISSVVVIEPRVRDVVPSGNPRRPFGIPQCNVPRCVASAFRARRCRTSAGLAPSRACVSRGP